MTNGLYGYDDDGRPMWDDCPGCGYSPGSGDDGLCGSCAADAQRPNEADMRAAAEALWDEAVFATDLDEGRMWASREWERRGEPLSKEAAVNRLLEAIAVISGS